MTSDALQVLQTLIGGVWMLLSTWEFPGTHMTPAELLFFSMFLTLVLRFLSRMKNGSDNNA